MRVSCDQRSDIYSFGVVLDEMAMHKYNSFKMNQRFNANTSEPALSAIINRCMEKNPDKRYQTFQELRRALEPLISQQSKERIQPSKTSEVQLEELNNKGAALNCLGRYNEALEYLNKALKINPNHAQPWVNKADSLKGLKRFEEALECVNKALEIDRQNPLIWNNKGNTLNNLKQFEEALECFNKALEINPQLAAVLSNKGRSLASLNRHFEALTCYEMALKLNPLHANAWFNKGITLGELGNPYAADECIKRSIEINSLLATATSPDRLRRLF